MWCLQRDATVASASPPERAGAHVFQEFCADLHNPERDRNKGLGLGLAIVQAHWSSCSDLALNLRSAPGQRHGASRLSICPSSHRKPVRE